jgi:VanZ family protein
MNPPLPDGSPVCRPRAHRSPLRLTVCVLLLLGILSTMVMIFLFSSESETQSGNRSDRVTEKVAPIVVPGYRDMSEEKQTQVVQQLDFPVRKLAHMTEYALLAVLTGALLVAWDSKNWRRLPIRWCVPAAFCLLYASSDEFHQIFSHRGASVVDVLIDFGGALIGLCLLWGISALVRKYHRRHSLN